MYSDLGFSRNLMDFMVTTKEPEFLRDVDGTEHSSNSDCRNLPFGGRATRDSRDACSTKGIRAESPPTFI